MSRERTTNRATRLFSLLALITLLPLAAAPLVHADGTWTNQTAPAAGPSARWQHAMASLGGDQVLLFGGLNVSGWNGETWVYDFSANTWADQAPTTAPSARDGHAMACLGGDKVLLFGGSTGGGIHSDETWVYDPSENTWTNQVPAAGPSARFRHAMAYLGGDQALLFGGYDGSYDGETWVYDLGDNTWTNQAPAAGPSGRYGHAMAYIGGDQVLLFGGNLGGGETWVYDLSDNTWTNQTPAAAPSARHQHGMASLGGDQVLLFGGGNVSGHNGDTWVYDLSDNTWTNQVPAAGPSARDYHAVASLGGNQVLLFGGDDDSGLRGETWVYDPSDNTWTTILPATGPSARRGHAMASLGGDQVLLFGGSAGPRDRQTWVYDLGDNTWTLKSPAAAPSAREDHSMASLGEGQVLLFGGFDDSGWNGETWVYDLSANTWTDQAPATAPYARVDHAMAYIGGDQVVLFGGTSGSPNDETWIYDLSDNAWTLRSPAGSPSARNGPAMASLGGDQVLLFGGFDGSYLGDTWVYDLSDNTWTNQALAATEGSPDRRELAGPSGRAGHAMACLGGDQALLFGGFDGSSRLGGTWVYDLSANTWTNQAPAAHPSARTTPAMAPLGVDRVLLFGGYTGSAYSDETWLATGFFTPVRVYLPLVYKGASGLLRVGMVSNVGGMDDAGFNQNTWAGLQRAQTELGVQVQFIESQSSADYEVNIAEFAEQGYDLVVTVGWLMGEATANMARAYPDTQMAIMDNAYDPPIPNVAGAVFGVDEAAFAAGYLAAGWAVLQDPTDPQIGFVTGMQIPPVEQFIVGYENGAMYYNGQNGTNVLVKGVYVNDFDSWDKGFIQGNSLIDEGVDVIFGVLGRTGDGALAAAKDRGKWGVGAEVDQYYTLPNQKDILLTSCLKRVDNAVFELVKQALLGSFPGGGIHYGTLENEGVGLAPYHDLAGQIPDELDQAVQAVIAGIIAGEIGTGWPVP